MIEVTGLSPQQPMSTLQQLVEHRWFKHTIVVLIVVNAIFLGMETARDLPATTLDALILINRTILGIFVAELILRIAAHRSAFFHDPWSLFDLVIIVGALLVPSGPLQVLRALRILRVLRLVSAVPSLRRVVDGLLSAVPGIASVMVLLLLLLYVGAVMATQLFQDAAPEHFGHLALSLFSLFQIMTLEGWPDIANEVMQSQRWAWVFFVGYILVATFMILNLVIGIVVSSIQSRIDEEASEQPSLDASVAEELSKLRQEVSELRQQLERRS